ncbi:MAG: hypothetical protein ACLR6H_00325 [Roseburia sp.]
MIKNYVNQKSRQNVSYTINSDHRQIDLYFTRDRRVIIVGTADNNYIFWLSVSACEDEAATGGGVRSDHASEMGYAYGTVPGTGRSRF